jgi:hypothetical protein
MSLTGNFQESRRKQRSLNNNDLSVEQISNPIASRAIKDPFAFAILKTSRNSKGQKRLDDFALSGLCSFRATAASTGILHSEMKRRRTCPAIRLPQWH